MADDQPIQTLTAAHRQLLDLLSELERIGEFSAAAHVAAAIDVLETRVGVDHGAEVHPGTSNSVAEIAGRMRDAFGEKAESVARRQLTTASGSAVLAWAAIVNRIADDPAR
jgi:hypothetical protein